MARSRISNVTCLGSVSTVEGSLVCWVGIVGSESRVSWTYCVIVGFRRGRRVLLVTIATLFGGILGNLGLLR